ncbi:MAG: SgcJ/EcaC family oxidoreductase, partial [Planctomycetales bacterium]|nr:SgcJ/EcaC family oxidoreductase [Planctomycetales bacterium]
MKRSVLLMIFLVCLGSLGHCQDSLSAKPGSPDEVESADESTIRANVKSYIEAFNSGNATALANHWTEGGDYLPPGGEKIVGQEALQKFFSEYFQGTKGAQLEVDVMSIELLSPRVAKERGVARVTGTDEPVGETTYEAIHVKTGDAWKIDSIREQAVAQPASHYDKLQELEWMIGSWVDADEESEVDTNCRWTPNGNFIVRSFKAFIGDGLDFEGTQVIGWDPTRQTIRSWTFDSDGGFGAGR